MLARRLKLIVAYDGAPFSGWQSQRDGNAVQDHLERAVLRITGETARVHGAGRTDAGVHALAQCAHVDLSKRLPAQRWTAAFNSVLPPKIRILSTHYVSSDFHARFSAKGKIYRYRIWAGAVVPPLEYGRSWHVVRDLDTAQIKSAAELLVGRHDFSGFAANRGRPESDSVRTMSTVKVNRRGPLLVFEFAADGFFYRMARLMTGALVDCGLGKMRAQDLAERLHGGSGGRRVAAPACGLFLVRVRY